MAENNYPRYDGVVMKPGVRVFCCDREHIAYDQTGTITAVHKHGSAFDFDVTFDGPDGPMKGPDFTMGADDIWPDDTNTEEAKLWRAQRTLRVFLCHGSEDKDAIRSLYKRILETGMRPWLDEKDLSPGVEWEPAIRRAVKDSHVILVCLSRQSASKIGFVQKEIRYALDRADEMPEGTVYVIPVRLEECAIPDRLAKWQAVDIYRDDGLTRLMDALGRRAQALARSTSV